VRKHLRRLIFNPRFPDWFTDVYPVVDFPGITRPNVELYRRPGGRKAPRKGPAMTCLHPLWSIVVHCGPLCLRVFPWRCEESSLYPRAGHRRLPGIHQELPGWIGRFWMILGREANHIHPTKTTKPEASGIRSDQPICSEGI